MTFHNQNQLSLKLHDKFNQKAILHVIDVNKPLSIANAIGKELKISPVFPWPVTAKTNSQGRNIIASVKFCVFPRQL